MARRRTNDADDAGPGGWRWRRTLGLGAMLAGLAGAAVVVMRRPGGGGQEGGGGPDPASMTAGYETHDMSAGGLARILIGFALTVAAAIGLMFWMTGFFVQRAVEDRPPLTAQEGASIVPPGPRLQVHPFQEIGDVSARENRILGSYGWLDPDHRRARIPIDRAMALTIGRALDPQPDVAPRADGAAVPVPTPPR